MADSSVAIVTGGAQGLGAAICETLLKEGWKVCVADVQKEKGKDFVEDMQKKYGDGRVLFCHCDVSKEPHIEETFDLTLDTFQKVDLLVNNAGIALEEDPKITISVNLLGVIYGCQAALRHMGKRNGGNGGIVINTSSIAGFYPFERAPSYTASKWGIIGYTRSYGHSYHYEKDGIIFAAICPSFMDTELLKIGREHIIDPNPGAPLVPNLMSPEYVAGGVMKILEDRINGSILLITNDGFKYIGLHEEFKDFNMIESQKTAFRDS